MKEAMFLSRPIFLAGLVGTFAVAGCGFGGGGSGGSVSPPSGGLQLSVVSGDGQTGIAGTQLSAPFVIALANGTTPVANALVTFAAASGNGSLSPAQAMTDAQGRASTTLRLGAAAGTNTVTASATGASSATFRATGLPSNQPSITIVSGDGQSGPAGTLLAQALVVALRDAAGNPASGVGVTFAVAAGGGSVMPSGATTDAQGRASTRLTLGSTAGMNTVLASAGGYVGSPATFTATGTSSRTLTFVDDVLSIMQAKCVICHGPGGAMATSPLTNFDQVRNGRSTSQVPVNYVTPSSPSQSLIVAKTTAPGSMAIHLTVAEAQTISDWVQQGAIERRSPPASMALVSGDAQSGPVGSTLSAPLVVVVRDAAGAPVAGVTVAFAIASGTGTLGATNPPTNSSGQAATTLALGSTAGPLTVTATVSGLGGSPVTFNETATAGAPAQIAIVSGDAQTGIAGSALANPFVVVVRDAGGNLVAGANVAFRVASGGGSLSASPVATDAQGRASSTLTLGQLVGPNSVEATVAGVATTLTFRSTGTSGPAARLVRISGDAQTALAGATLPAPLVVAVQDVYGNAVAGTTVSFAATAGGGSVAPATAASSGMGLASTSLTLGATPGTNTVTATVAGLSGSPVTFTETGTSATAPTMTILSGDAQTGPAGTALANPLVVQIRDSAGAPVANVTVTFAIGLGGGSLSATSVPTNALGQASTQLTLGPLAGANTVTASATGVTGSPLTFRETATAGTATQIARVSGDAQTGTVGAALAPLVVVVRDAAGNPVSGFSVTFAAASGGGSVNPGSMATDAQGLASTVLTLGLTAGTNTVTATATGLTGSPVTFTETGTPGAATQISLASGNGQSAPAGSTLPQPFVAAVRDAGGNPVQGFSITFAVASGGGSLSAMTVATDANGRAATVLTLGTTPGANSVTATATGLTGSPVTFTATGLTVATRTYVADVRQILQTNCTTCHSASGGQRPLDTYTAVVNGTSLTWSPAAYVTPSQPAQSLLYLKITGAPGVGGPMPPSGSLPAATIAIIRDWIQTGALEQSVQVPTQIALTSGEGQTGATGGLLVAPLVVTVRDAANNPVSGVTVAFAAASGGGSVNPASQATDAMGHAQTFLTLGPAAGANTVTATANGPSGTPLQGSPVTFHATATTSSFTGEPLRSSSHPLDQAAYLRLQQLQVEPAPLCTDGEFLRRVTADLAGRLPTETELTAFLADAAATRRANAVDRLLASGEFADHWTADILGPWLEVPAVVQPAGTPQPPAINFDAAVRADVAADVPLSTLAQRLATQTGDEGRGLWMDQNHATAASRCDQLMHTFTGMTTKCARCHNHPHTIPGSDDPVWNQDDNYKLYAFFAMTPDDATEINRDGSAKVDALGNPIIMQPGFVADGYASAPTGLPTLADPLATRTARFGQLLVASNAFARGTANRIWSEIWAPLLDPNQIRYATLTAAETSRPGFLRALADGFRAQGASLKGFLRWCMSSKLYQLSSNGTTTAYDASLARAKTRRHHSEVLERGIAQLAGVTYAPSGSFADAFGYPSNRATITERKDSVNIAQPMLLMNRTPTAASVLQSAAIGAFATAIDGGTMTLQDAVTRLYRQSLSRDPDASELTRILGERTTVTSTTAEFLQDVAIGLLTSTEFPAR